MRTLSRLTVTLALGALCLNADPSLGPVLQWVKTIGGSGNNQVTAAAADAKGNLYITGNTFSVDFPVTSAAQRNAGGSTLVRINTATRTAQKLYPAGLSGATSIQVDPQNSQILYATQGNAIWRSADGGDTWAILPAVSPGVAVNFAAVDPRDSNILYAATRQQGVFKSTDGGQTWRAINSGIPPARDGTFNSSQVWTDPKIPQVVFASAATKLLRSANGGESWTVAFSSDFGIVTLAFDRLSAGTLYLVTGASISKSTDDGIRLALRRCQLYRIRARPTYSSPIPFTRACSMPVRTAAFIKAVTEARRGPRRPAANRWRWRLTQIIRFSTQTFRAMGSSAAWMGSVRSRH